MRKFFFKVWHAGYASNICIQCEKSDLVSIRTLKSKLCVALFDHGLPIEKIDYVQSNELFYVYKNEFKVVSHPMSVPNRAFLSSNDAIRDDDPEVFQVQIVDDVVLPIEIESVHMRSLSDIEFFTKRRLARYGVALSKNSAFFIQHAKWTLCTPTRRDFKYRIVSISPVNFDAKLFVRHVRVVQRKFRNMQRHRAAKLIQHRWIEKQQKATDWVHLNPLPTMHTNGELIQSI